MCEGGQVWEDGQIEAQRVTLAGIETVQSSAVAAHLIRAAVDRLAAEFDGLAEHFHAGCWAPVDGIDAVLTLPDDDLSMSCVDLPGIAAEVGSFGELVTAMTEALGEKAGLLRQIAPADSG